MDDLGAESGVESVPFEVQALCVDAGEIGECAVVDGPGCSLVATCCRAVRE
ncbi:hypothetical protein AB0C70_03405 [Streptomyces sp. NPDC048564]|uniref:hypothetical protein n=1 Tax=Streptomyces sp. NPDC048564 TaxID=3155760 RepID=UPI0034255661